MRERSICQDVHDGRSATCRRDRCLDRPADRLPLPDAPRCPIEPAGRLVANIKSQIKRNRRTRSARDRNKAVRSELKTRTKRPSTAADAGADERRRALPLGHEAHRQGRGQGRASTRTRPPAASRAWSRRPQRQRESDAARPITGATRVPCRSATATAPADRFANRATSTSITSSPGPAVRAPEIEVGLGEQT